MPQVNIVEKKVKMGTADVIKYQLMTHCFINKISLSDSDIDCLTELSLMKEVGLNTFCKHISNKKIFKSAQTVRNSINESEKHNLIIKKGRNKKTIYINPDLGIQSSGNILLDFKFLAIESQES